jgi:LL-H family phage holin
MNDITFAILKIVVSVCAAILTYVLTYYVVPYIKTLCQEKRYKALFDAVMTGVQAAEQTIKEPGQGDYKKAEVIAFVSDWMMEHGIKISQDELSQLIECAVFSMHQEG